MLGFHPGGREFESRWEYGKVGWHPSAVCKTVAPLSSSLSLTTLATVPLASAVESEYRASWVLFHFFS